MHSKYYLNGLALALWKTGGVPDMWATNARQTTQEFQDVERDERARDVSRMVQDAVPLEDGAKMAAWQPLPCPAPH